MALLTNQTFGRWHFRLIGSVVLAIVGTAIAWNFRSTVTLPSSIPLTEYRRAEQRFREMYHRSPSRPDVLSLLGEMAVELSDLDLAVACFREIPSEDPHYGLAARLQQGQVNLRLHRAAAAEDNFREVLKLSNTRSATVEQVRDAYKRLVYILSIELRFEERRQVLADMHALEIADVYDSKQFHFPNLLLWNSSTGRHRLQEFREQDPQNDQLNVVHGRYLTAEGKLAEARLVLEALHRRHPLDPVFLSALMEYLFEQNNWDQLNQLAPQLPEYHADEPWLLTRMRGEIAGHSGDWQMAIKQFERLQQFDPANPWCQMGLARAYAGLQDAKSREQALHKSLVLSRIRVDLMTVKEDNPRESLALAKLCDEAGLSEAAETFRKHASRIKSRAGQLNSSSLRL